MNFNYKSNSTLLSVAEFCKESGLSVDKVIDYIHMGKLFPLAPIRQSVLIRRIPSLLTEHLSMSLKNKDNLDRLINKPRIYKGFNEHIKNWNDFIDKYSADAKKDNVELSDKCVPWFSDIRYTSGEYVYIDPGVVKEAMNFGTASIKRFVFTDFMRGFYSRGCVLDMLNLYEDYKQLDYSGSDDPVSIISRFSHDYHLKYERNTSFCYPDQVHSFDYFGVVDKPLPVAMPLIAEYLDLEFEDCDYSTIFRNDSWFSLLEKTDKKIKEIIYKINQKNNQYIFHNLCALSGYLDQWIPFYPERNDLVCSFESLRLSSEQIKTVQSITNNEAGFVTLTDNARRDFINYQYWVQSAFIYHLMKAVKTENNKDHKYIINSAIDLAIDSAEDQLNKDDLFKIILRSCSGVSNSQNFYNQIRNIKDNSGSKVFVYYLKKHLNKESKPSKRKSPNTTTLTVPVDVGDDLVKKNELNCPADNQSDGSSPSINNVADVHEVDMNSISADKKVSSMVNCISSKPTK